MKSILRATLRTLENWTAPGESLGTGTWPFALCERSRFKMITNIKPAGNDAGLVRRLGTWKELAACEKAPVKPTGRIVSGNTYQETPPVS